MNAKRDRLHAEHGRSPSITCRSAASEEFSGCRAKAASERQSGAFGLGGRAR